MTRRALLAGLLAFFQRPKRKMAFTPHWIDLPNGAGDVVDGIHHSDIFVRQGNVLYSAVLTQYGPNNIGPFSNETYKSLDSGKTWTDLGMGPIFVNNLSNAFFVPRVNDGLIYLFWIQNARMRRVIFDPSVPSWSTDVSATPTPGVPDSGEAPNGCAFVRPDGSIIIGFQFGNHGNLAFLKYIPDPLDPLDFVDAPLLGPISDGSQYRIKSGVMDAAGNIHILVSRSIDGEETWDFGHFSLAAADDSISGFHLIEAAVENNFNPAPTSHPGSGCVAADGKIIFPFGYRVTTNFASGFSYGVLHVAFGDPTMDPLNPTWVVTVVNPTPDLPIVNLPSAGATWASTALEGSMLAAYYISRYPLPLNDFSTVKQQLWKSTWSGSAWGTPVLWYDPPGTSAGVAMVRLVRAFPDGVGIALDIYNATIAGVDYPEISAYDGPPMGAAGYASAGGALAGPGNYAAA